MTDSEAPLRAATEEVGSEATRAFELLGSEKRLAILLAMWEAYDPHAVDNTVPFSQLREAVGMRDSGQFNYHLTKLQGVFVEKTPDGYKLRPVGLKLVQTVVAGAGSDVTLPETEIDVACSLCGAPTVVTYQGGWLYHLCTECEGAFGGLEDYPSGALFAEPIPPAALENRTAEEIFAAGVFMLQAIFSMKMGGVCPQCSGVFDMRIDVCPDHHLEPGIVCKACGNTAEMRVKWTCSVCKYRGSTTAATALGLHPAVLAFYHDHGVDIGYTTNDFENAKQFLELIRRQEQEVISTDPLRVRLTVTMDGDTIQLTADESLKIVGITES